MFGRYFISPPIASIPLVMIRCRDAWRASQRAEGDYIPNGNIYGLELAAYIQIICWLYTHTHCFIGRTPVETHAMRLYRWRIHENQLFIYLVNLPNMTGLSVAVPWVYNGISKVNLEEDPYTFDTPS